MVGFQPSNYPDSWFEVNELLNEDADDFIVLFLPWHQYLAFNFTHPKVIGNPADTFFDRKVIAGDNIEMGKIYTQSVRPESAYVENELVFAENPMKDLGNKLNHLNTKYVILATGGTYKNYKFLDKSEELEIVYYSEDLVLYLNKVWQKSNP